MGAYASRDHRRMSKRAPRERDWFIGWFQAREWQNLIELWEKQLWLLHGEWAVGEAEELGRSVAAIQERGYAGSLRGIRGIMLWCYHTMWAYEEQVKEIRSAMVVSYQVESTQGPHQELPWTLSVSKVTGHLCTAVTRTSDIRVKSSEQTVEIAEDVYRSNVWVINVKTEWHNQEREHRSRTEQGWDWTSANPCDPPCFPQWMSLPLTSLKRGRADLSWGPGQSRLYLEWMKPNLAKVLCD